VIEQLGGLFVKADDWIQRIVRLSIRVEHGFNAPDEVSAYLGGTPTLNLPRFERVFSVSSHRLVADAVHHAQRHQSIRQQLHRPGFPPSGKEHTSAILVAVC